MDEGTFNERESKMATEFSVGDSVIAIGLGNKSGEILSIGGSSTYPVYIVDLGLSHLGIKPVQLLSEELEKELDNS